MNPNKKLRVVAVYLPQYHPISENDNWWGKGFTEWTNVTKAKPLFKSHYQPHLPADLGFYDLRLPEVRIQQAKLAEEYGIYGFCYYHYWFNGRRILERPFNEVFESGSPDFPFMLCWANENWTRAWDGGERHILLEQKYSKQDDLHHINTLLPFFKDKRYIRINNKPVFAVYKTYLFPDIAETAAIWREAAAKQGMELYLCFFESLGQPKIKPSSIGFDAAIQFPPFGIASVSMGKTNAITPARVIRSIYNRTRNFYRQNFQKANYISYKQLIKKDLGSFPSTYKQFPGVTPMWDNTARRKRPTIITGSTPMHFEFWVQQKIERYVPYSEEENLFFINAWNEWAEGNHLEPCQRWGKAYLEGLQRALSHTNES